MKITMKMMNTIQLFRRATELKHVSFCEQTRREYRNLAMAKQELLKLEGEKIHATCLEEKCSPDETKLRQIVKNRKHVAIVSYERSRFEVTSRLRDLDGRLRGVDWQLCGQLVEKDEKFSLVVF